MSKFAELAKINVNEHTEKKNGLTYLSWAWAVDQLLRLDDGATWTYLMVDSRPYVQIGDTCMVFCTVNAFGKARTAQLPVMDYKNKAIPNPDAMAVNTAMQRCLAKAIALHGIGLYIYAGEDLPEGESAATTAVAAPSRITPVAGSLASLEPSEQQEAKTIANAIVDYWTAGEEFKAYEAFYDAGLTNEMKLGVWEVLQPHSKIRNKLKAMHKDQPTQKAA
jgi:hypothetical protein